MSDALSPAGADGDEQLAGARGGVGVSAPTPSFPSTIVTVCTARGGVLTGAAGAVEVAGAERVPHGRCAPVCGASIVIPPPE